MNKELKQVLIAALNGVPATAKQEHHRRMADSCRDSAASAVPPHAEVGDGDSVAADRRPSGESVFRRERVQPYPGGGTVSAGDSVQ